MHNSIAGRSSAGSVDHAASTAFAGAPDMPARKRSKRSASEAVQIQADKENAAANPATRKRRQSKRAARPAKRKAPEEAEM